MAHLPTYIIAGAMRCGTTSLNSYLRAHPEVAVASKKEVHFFDHHFDEGLDWYRAMFPAGDDVPAVGEATPNYLFDPAAIRRIHATLPEVRLVVMLRNPADRAYSHYWHDRSRGKIDVTFADAVDAELAGEAVEGSYVARGRYREQLQRVLDLFPRDAVLVETFEDMVERPTEVYASVCRHLGVDDSFRPTGLGQAVNAYQGFRSLRVRRMTKALPPSVGKLVGRLNAKRAESYPPMDPEVRHRLVPLFAAANAGLDELLGRSSPIWK